MDYSCKNAKPVLDNVNKYIEELEGRLTQFYRHPKVLIKTVCDELSIFDWWKDYLTLADLKKMRAFLNKAIKMGYTGYVCFKVGISGCASGMWAYKAESTNGYSPDSEWIYRNFNNEKAEWSMLTEAGDIVKI